MSYIKSLCRACLTTKATLNYFIFENVCPDIFCFCTSIEVSRDEELPKGLCNPCYELLEKYSEFKRTCLQSQATLLDLKNDLKYESDLAPGCEDISSNYLELKDQYGKIKPEIENPVKLENEGVDDHDFMEDFNHDDTELNEDKYFVKRKVKKLVKLKKHKNKVVKQKVRKKFIYTCDVCQKKFNFKERFEAHKLEHEGKVAGAGHGHMSTIAIYMYDSGAGLWAYELIIVRPGSRVLGIESVNCGPCNKTFLTWSGLKRHTESEHTQVNLESLKCTTCGKIFKSRQTLKMHEKMHGSRRLIMCDVCGKGFTTAVILRAHLETHKENRERRFTCQHCGKKFFTNTILLSHVSRRHSGRRFICQICSYPFTDKYNLAKHLLIHDGKKLYKCEICDKSYATQSTLTEHKRLHSGERPYVCNYCVKAFVSKKRLTDHVRIHTGDKPHKCTLCEQRFTQRGTLKRHMKVHDRAVPTLG